MAEHNQAQSKRKKVFGLLPFWGAVLLAALVLILGGGVFITHGTIEAQGFCNSCHNAFYDAGEYAFNNKVGMKKPSGMLTGCAECHPQPYAEFKKSAHFDTKKLERRPGCTNCHNEPHSIAAWYDYMYWQPVSWMKLQLSLHDNVVWEKEVRPDLAAKARSKFVQSDSAACRGCHNEAAKSLRTEIKAHKQAAESKETCVKCHYNLVHAKVHWPDKDKNQSKK